ncbi:MAG: PQQ-like beta-propeller repeat protein [Planctomycetes bacterium]|nr:PQQ-like beta-propeller repeat protein [Planctomycetota bacterium]
MKIRLLVSLAFLLIGSLALADDWPQFRGPDRNGISKEKGLLKMWPNTGPKLAWTFKDAGLGCSSVAVVKGVIYTLGTDANFTGEYAIAISAKDGKELWRVKIGPLYEMLVERKDKQGKVVIVNANSYGDGPRSTPTIDGDFLYALGGEGQLVCLDITKKGKAVWRKHLVKDLGGVIMDKYGHSESPLIDGYHVICTPGWPKGTLAALKKDTGAVVWRSGALVEAAPFSSIVAADLHGVRQYIQTSYDNTAGNESGSVSGIDAKNGNTLWTKTFFKGTNDGIGSSPIVIGNSVFVSAGFGGGCQLFDIGKDGTAKPTYKTNAVKLKVQNTHGGLVLIGDYLYGHSESKKWVCQEPKTCTVQWTHAGTLKNKLGCISGSIVSAEGLLYLYTDDGDVGLVEADSTAFKLISTFSIPVKSQIPANRNTSRQARVWAHPAIANGHLYLRDHEYIFAFKIN